MALAPKWRNWLRTLGAPEDPVATDTSSEWSAMSLLKAIYGQLAGGGLQAALVSSLAGTSASSVLIGTGAKTFTTQSGKSWQAGQWLNIASDADEANFMNGFVTSYSGTTLIMSIDNIGGAGTFADWVISLSGTQGATGATGQTGDTGPAGADGEVAGPASAVIGNLAAFGAVDGNTLTDSGYAPIDEDSMATDSATRLPSQQSVKAYVDAAIAAVLSGVSSAFDTLAEIATELALKATIASPTFTGTPAAPTAATGTNTTQIATTAYVKAEIPLVAMGQGKHTVSVPGVALWARVTAGPGAASRELTTGDDIMIRGLSFDSTTEEAAQFYIRWPKGWNEGTITAQVYWTNAAGLTTETVTWGISGVALHDGDPMDSTSLGTEVTVTDTWLAQNDLHISAETSAITFGNSPAEGDLCIIQIARKTGTDNMTGDVDLLDLALFYTTNAATDA
jgi:hypothetical protein